MKNKIILISGKATSGKTTLANTLIDDLETEKNIFGIKLSLAAKLKELTKPLIDYFGVEDKEVTRPILQTVGQVGRAIEKDYWIEIMKSKIRVAFWPTPQEEPYQFIVIDDVRFRNELEAFGDTVDEVIKVKVEGQTKEIPTADDISENDIPEDYKFDIVIPSYKNKEAYENSIKELKGLICE